MLQNNTSQLYYNVQRGTDSLWEGRATALKDYNMTEMTNMFILSTFQTNYH